MDKNRREIIIKRAAIMDLENQLAKVSKQKVKTILNTQIAIARAGLKALEKRVA